MRIHVLAIGKKPTGWVDAGVQNYQKRLPKHLQLEFKNLSAENRVRNMPPDKSIRIEGDRLLKAIPAGAYTIALDERGSNWRSKELAGHLENWLANHSQIAILIGGADGLADSCREQADAMWSLSALTLPHALVRVLVAEQVYRAWTLLQGHPYHRE